MYFSCVCLSLIACQTLAVSQLDSVIIAPPGPLEGDGQTLAHLQPAWEELETLVRSQRIAAIGTSDLDKDLLEQLYNWAQVSGDITHVRPNPEDSYIKVRMAVFCLWNNHWPRFLWTRWSRAVTRSTWPPAVWCLLTSPLLLKSLTSSCSHTTTPKVRGHSFLFASEMSVFDSALSLNAFSKRDEVMHCSWGQLLYECI